MAIWQLGSGKMIQGTTTATTRSPSEKSMLTATPRALLETEVTSFPVGFPVPYA